MNLRHLLYLPLAVGLFASCNKDRQDASLAPSDKPAYPASSIDKEVSLSFELGGNLEELQEARSMQYELVDRRKLRGEQNDNHAGEFASQIKLNKGDKYTVYLVFVREKDKADEKPLVFRTFQPFVVVETPKGLRLEFKGDINFPSSMNGKRFADDYRARLTSGKSKWYVMGLFGFTNSVADNNDNGKPFSYHGVDNTHVLERIGLGHGVFNAKEGTTQIITGVPFISQWQQVRLGAKTLTDGTERIAGEALDLHFQPQGTLLQIDLGIDLNEVIDMRRFGIITNTLDLGGHYWLESDDIYNRFTKRDPNTGIGLPRWEADKPYLAHYSMHFSPARQDILTTSAQRGYPWHMPSISDNNYTPTVPSGSSALNLTDSPTSGEVYSLGFIRNNQKVYSHYYNPDNAWIFHQMSPNSGFGARKILSIWGMPRAQKAGNPYTYIWTSLYSLWGYVGGTNSTQDRYINSFNPEFLTIEGREASQYRAELEEYIRMGQASDADKLRAKRFNITDPKTSQTVSVTGQELLARYSADSTLYYGTLQPETLKQQTMRTQPIVPIYQSNFSDFQPKKIYHIQTLVQADLLITEVKYREVNGHNYSAVEIFNPRTTHANLSDYALVRLAPNTHTSQKPQGSYLAFVKNDGSTTDQLNEAMLLPLKYSYTKGIDGASEFGISAQTEASERSRFADSGIEQSYTRTGWTAEYYNSNFPSNKYQGKVFADKELWTNQTLIIGASGYINKLDNHLWCFSSEAEARAPKGSGFLNHLFAYATGAEAKDKTQKIYAEGVADYHPGDAFALVKHNGKDAWQIIDATGPIGIEGKAFAGSYADFKQTFTNLQGKEFTVKRTEGVMFPFIAPYRTKRNKSTEHLWSDDWEISVGAAHNLGYRSNHSYFTRSRTQFGGFTPLLKRMPLNKDYKTYWNNIPSQTRD